MKKLYLTPLFILSFFFSCAQSGRKTISIEDYKGEIDPDSKQFAFTQAGVYYTVFPTIHKCGISNQIKLKIVTVVKLSDRSWFNVEAAKKANELDQLLSHEQGHYDIHEIFSEDMRYRVAKDCFNRETYKKQISDLYNNLFLHYDSLQTNYDVQTDHMNNKFQQKKWKQFIQRKLDSLINLNSGN